MDAEAERVGAGDEHAEAGGDRIGGEAKDAHDAPPIARRSRRPIAAR